MSLYRLIWLLPFILNAEENDREVYKGLYFRDAPQVVAGPNQNLNILPHLDGLRRVDRIEEKDGWVKVNLYYSHNNALSEPITSWIWHSNYAQYVEPYFKSGSSTDVTKLKQKSPIDPKSMRTYTVSLLDDFQAKGIPARDAQGKKVPYWAPAGDDTSPLRLIYTVPDMHPRWVPREVVEPYQHVSKAKTDFLDSSGNAVIKKGNHIVEISFDKDSARVYSLNDPDRIVYKVPVSHLRSLEHTEPLKVELSELEGIDFIRMNEKTDSMVAYVPGGNKQEFVNSKMKRTVLDGPLKLVKLSDGTGKFSWATRVQVMSAKGKSLGNFYVSDKMFSAYQNKGSHSVEEVADEDEGLRDTRSSKETEVAEGSAGTLGHLGKILGKTSSHGGFPVKYDSSDKYCGERAGKYAKYYYEEPRLTDRHSKYKTDFIEAANSAGLSPGLLAGMVHIESKFNPSLENISEKRSVGSNEHHKSNPSIWGKGIAQLGRAECKVLGCDWFGSYSENSGRTGSVWDSSTAIDGMAELVLKKVKEINIIEKKHNQLVAQGKRKYKIVPEGSLARFMLDRTSYQPPPSLKADGSNRQEIANYHKIAEAEKTRYLVSMYNRGMRAPNAVLAYLERTGSLPGYYGQAWSEPPHSTQKRDDVLMLQQINRGHIYRSAGLCGDLPSDSIIAKYGTDYLYDSSADSWSLK